MDQNEYVYVALDRRHYNEFVLRTRDPNCNVSMFVEHAVEGFLDRTVDEDIWSEEYLEERMDHVSTKRRRDIGAEREGYRWQSLFLVNGTELRMDYKGKRHVARIAHRQIRYETNVFSSPSEFASHVANHTARNAWRDLEVRVPRGEWTRADHLRREKERSESDSGTPK
jgi:hypothetical protein